MPEPPGLPVRGSDRGPLLPLNFQRNMIAKLKRRDRNGFFHEPVDPHAVPLYYQVIPHPLCLNEINSRINKHHYKHLNDYIDDVFRVCDNAMYFNPEDSVYHQAAAELKKDAAVIFDEIRPQCPPDTGPSEAEIAKQQLHAKQLAAESKRNATDLHSAATPGKAIKRARADSPDSQHHSRQSFSSDPVNSYHPTIRFRPLKTTQMRRQPITLADSYKALQVQSSILQNALAPANSSTDALTQSIGPLTYNEYRPYGNIPFDARYPARFQRFTHHAAPELQPQITSRFEQLLAENNIALSRPSVNDYVVPESIMKQVNQIRSASFTKDAPFGVPVTKHFALIQFLVQHIQSLPDDEAHRKERAALKHVIQTLHTVLKVAKQMPQFAPQFPRSPVRQDTKPTPPTAANEAPAAAAPPGSSQAEPHNHTAATPLNTTAAGNQVQTAAAVHDLPLPINSLPTANVNPSGGNALQSVQSAPIVQQQPLPAALQSQEFNASGTVSGAPAASSSMSTNEQSATAATPTTSATETIQPPTANHTQPVQTSEYVNQTSSLNGDQQIASNAQTQSTAATQSMLHTTQPQMLTAEAAQPPPADAPELLQQQQQLPSASESLPSSQPTITPVGGQAASSTT